MLHSHVFQYIQTTLVLEGRKRKRLLYMSSTSLGPWPLHGTDQEGKRRKGQGVCHHVGILAMQTVKRETLAWVAKHAAAACVATTGRTTHRQPDCKMQARIIKFAHGHNGWWFRCLEGATVCSVFGCAFQAPIERTGTQWQMIPLPVRWLGPRFQSPHQPKEKEEHRSVWHQPSVTSSTVPSNLPLDGLEGINKKVPTGSVIRVL